MITGHVLIKLAREYYVKQEIQKYEEQLNKELEAESEDKSKKEIQHQKQQLKEKLRVKKEEWKQKYNEIDVNSVLP